MKLLLTLVLILYTLNSFSQQKEHLQDSIQKNTIPNSKFSNLISKDSVNFQISDTLTNSIFYQVNKLDEVYINSKSEFNAVSLGIIKKKIKPLSTNERRLYTAGDFKPIHLLSLLGGSLEIDPIINAISGRTKRLKRYIKLEQKENNIDFLEEHFSEYMLDNLNIPKSNIGKFINYLIDNEKLENLIKRQDFGELYFWIGDEWFKYKIILDDSLSKP